MSLIRALWSVKGVHGVPTLPLSLPPHHLFPPRYPSRTISTCPIPQFKSPLGRRPSNPPVSNSNDPPASSPPATSSPPSSSPIPKPTIASSPQEEVRSEEPFQSQENQERFDSIVENKPAPKEKRRTLRKRILGPLFNFHKPDPIPDFADRLSPKNPLSWLISLRKAIQPKDWGEDVDINDLSDEELLEKFKNTVRKFELDERGKLLEPHIKSFQDMVANVKAVGSEDDYWKFKSFVGRAFVERQQLEYLRKKAVIDRRRRAYYDTKVLERLKRLGVPDSEIEQIPRKKVRDEDLRYETKPTLPGAEGKGAKEDQETWFGEILERQADDVAHEEKKEAKNLIPLEEEDPNRKLGTWDEEYRHIDWVKFARERTDGVDEDIDQFELTDEQLARYGIKPFDPNDQPFQWLDPTQKGLINPKRGVYRLLQFIREDPPRLKEEIRREIEIKLEKGLLIEVRDEKDEVIGYEPPPQKEPLKLPRAEENIVTSVTVGDLRPEPSEKGEVVDQEELDERGISVSPFYAKNVSPTPSTLHEADEGRDDLEKELTNLESKVDTKNDVPKFYTVTDDLDSPILKDVPLHSVEGEPSIIPYPESTAAKLTERFLDERVLAEVSSGRRGQMADFEVRVKEVYEQIEKHKNYGEYKRETGLTPTLENQENLVESKKMQEKLAAMSRPERFVFGVEKMEEADQLEDQAYKEMTRGEPYIDEQLAILGLKREDMEIFPEFEPSFKLRMTKKFIYSTLEKKKKLIYNIMGKIEKEVDDAENFLQGMTERGIPEEEIEAKKKEIETSRGILRFQQRNVELAVKVLEKRAYIAASSFEDKERYRFLDKQAKLFTAISRVQTMTLNAHNHMGTRIARNLLHKKYFALPADFWKNLDMQVGNFERLSAEEIRAVDLGNLKTDQVEKFAFSKQYTSWMAKMALLDYGRRHRNMAMVSDDVAIKSSPERMLQPFNATWWKDPGDGERMVQSHDPKFRSTQKYYYDNYERFLYEPVIDPLPKIMKIELPGEFDQSFIDYHLDRMLPRRLRGAAKFCQNMENLAGDFPLPEVVQTEVDRLKLALFTWQSVVAEGDRVRDSPTESMELGVQEYEEELKRGLSEEDIAFGERLTPSQKREMRSKQIISLSQLSDRSTLPEKLQNRMDEFAREVRATPTNWYKNIPAKKPVEGYLAKRRPGRYITQRIRDDLDRFKVVEIPYPRPTIDLLPPPPEPFYVKKEIREYVTALRSMKRRRFPHISFLLPKNSDPELLSQRRSLFKEKKVKLTLRRRFTDLVKSIVPPARADYQDFYDKFMIDALGPDFNPQVFNHVYGKVLGELLLAELKGDYKTFLFYEMPTPITSRMKALRKEYDDLNLGLEIRWTGDFHVPEVNHSFSILSHSKTINLKTVKVLEEDEEVDGKLLKAGSVVMTTSGYADVIYRRFSKDTGQPYKGLDGRRFSRVAGYLTLYCERTNKVDGNKWKPLDYKYVESGPERNNRLIRYREWRDGANRLTYTGNQNLDRVSILHTTNTPFGAPEEEDPVLKDIRRRGNWEELRNYYRQKRREQKEMWRKKGAVIPETAEEAAKVEAEREARRKKKKRGSKSTKQGQEDDDDVEKKEHTHDEQL